MIHPSLTPAEAERLEILAEEAGEVVQMVMKTLRHGKESFNPRDPKETPNLVLLSSEVGNFQRAVQLCIDCGDLSPYGIEVGSSEKSQNLLRYTHHQTFSPKENS